MKQNIKNALHQSSSPRCLCKWTGSSSTMCPWAPTIARAPQAPMQQPESSQKTGQNWCSRCILLRLLRVHQFLKFFSCIFIIFRFFWMRKGYVQQRLLFTKLCSSPWLWCLDAHEISGLVHGSIAHTVLVVRMRFGLQKQPPVAESSGLWFVYLMEFSFQQH